MDTGVLKNGSTTQPNSSVCQTTFAYGAQLHEGLAGAGGNAPTGTPGRGMDRLAQGKRSRPRLWGPGEARKPRGFREESYTTAEAVDRQRPLTGRGR